MNLISTNATSNEVRTFSFEKISSLTPSLEIIDNNNIFFDEYGYRYGASIIKKSDNTYYAWYSSEGNNSSEWDYIRFYKGENEDSWSEGEIVLKPSEETKDKFSTCDPGVIYFNDYYYIGYTSTDYDLNGMGNSAFVARSLNPDGPYEKWNGNGWGGEPQPFIEWTGDESLWGIGEVSFVLVEEQLYIYFSLIDENGYSTYLAKSNLDENWPSNITTIGRVYKHGSNDSLDVAYDEYSKSFFALSVKNRMNMNSELMLLQSFNGEEFLEIDSKKIDNYSHNVGISKDISGHIDTSDVILVSYAYGGEWANWKTKLINILIH